MNNYVNSEATFVNCLFSGNSAVHGGGMGNYNAQPVLINCTFTGNQATNGGAIYNYGAAPTLTNCVLWNDAEGATPEIVNTNGSMPLIDYCDIEGCGGSGAQWNASFGTDAGGNIDAAPLFVDADGVDGAFGTLDDDVRLLSGSPCIDAADNTAVPEDAVDLDGDDDLAEPLPMDLGGEPRFHDDPGTIDTGIGDPPIVDMGAHEFQGTTEPACPWDCEDEPDGSVGIDDLVAIINHWGPCPAPPADCPWDCEDEPDCNVGIDDLVAVINHWGSCP